MARYHLDGDAARGAATRTCTRDRARARTLGGVARLQARHGAGRHVERRCADAVRERRVQATSRIPLPHLALTATDWVAALSPWPEEFGLGRMRALLDELGNPQRAFRSVHVVRSEEH